MNVLLNAGESMQGSNGVVDVHFSRTESKEASESNYISLLISDRGGGISQDSLDKVFDPFFTTKKKGHGLGLAVSKQIMQRLDGKIAIAKRAGGGTEVLITCPEARSIPKEESSYTPKATIDINVRSRKILVVDDEPDVREVAAELLASMHHEAILASNADEAVALFASQHESIDAVMLDLKMPGRDGWSCLQDIRNISADKPVIICSGFNPVRRLAELCHAGF